MISEYISKTAGLPIIPEPNDWTGKGYAEFNTGGVECEVGEFLYGLVRMMKPDNVLETGTYLGISASYIGCALRDNGRGILTTIEFDLQWKERAASLFKRLGIEDYIDPIHKLVEEVELPEDYSCDIMFLDTEPHLRFAELLRFWGDLKSGGVVIIHDLHPGMSQGHTYPFGRVPEEMKKLIREGELQSLHFQPTRGLYVGQKKREDFYTSEILASNLIQPKGEGSQCLG